MNRLQSMQVFTRVVSLGSFSRAAAELGMSAAAVTQHVRELESALGVRLLNRTTRRSSLTEQGRFYFDHCLHVLEEIRHAEEVLGQAAGVAHGVLRVDIPMAFARLVLLPRLPAFLARHPGLKLHVTMENRNTDLLGRDLDCALRIGALDDSRLVARRIGQLHWVTCAAPAYLAVHGTPTAPAELAGHNCLGFLQVENRQVLPWTFARDGIQTAVDVDGNLAFNSLDTLVEAARAGMGIAQVADVLVEDALAAGSLVRVLPAWQAAGPAVSVLYPHRQHLPEKVRVFTDFCAELLGG